LLAGNDWLKLREYLLLFRQDSRSVLDLKLRVNPYQEPNDLVYEESAMLTFACDGILE